MTFGGRRSRLKHPGSVGAWLWVAGAGNGTLHVRCSVTLCGRRMKHPGSVGAWLWVAGAGKGALQCDAVWQATFGGRRSRLKSLVALECGSGWLVQGMVR